jgi:RHH-type proline utilization regulon transcriptional repressor/proline dehydrogenase/delta 1-pyrroline-5-carboxylate dehydrogenase
MFGDARQNSRGHEFGHAATLEALLASRDFAPYRATSIIGGKAGAGTASPSLSPIDGRKIGEFVPAMPADIAAAMQAASSGFESWSRTKPATRAALLRKAADLFEAQSGRLLALLQAEAGKTLDDAVAELREAVDFLRYYAQEAERLLAQPVSLPGPTGEENILQYRARGTFAAIAPWNFPLAIFVGQLAAALAAGNCVIAKPAEQTPLIGHLATVLLHRAGLPEGALQCLLGDGTIGAALVNHPAIAGVVFTGSTETARRINRALAAKDGPIVPLIAETGGINAMIVDATALP